METNAPLTTVQPGDSRTEPLAPTPPEETLDPQLAAVIPSDLPTFNIPKQNQAEVNLPSNKNFATDSSMGEQISNLYQLCIYSRQERKALELAWREIISMDMMQHDDNRKYKGRSNAYLPVGRRNLDALVAQLSSGLFPSDDYFDVVDRADQSSQKAKNTKAYIQWELETISRIRQEMKPYLRQYAGLGTTIGKYRYVKNIKREGRLTVGGPGSYGGAFRKMCVEGTRFDTRSVFNWYIYPATASSIDDAMLVFEDVTITKHEVDRLIKNKRWVNPTEARQSGTNTEAEQVEQDLRSKFKLGTTPSTQNPAGGDLSSVSFFSECWVSLILPDEAYLPEEDKGTPVPCKVVLTSSGICVELVRNPHWDQRPPYTDGRMNVQPGMYYGMGFGSTVQPMQYLSNDFANQMNDNGIYALNPITKVNPGMLVGPLRPLAPGVTWYMTDPSGVTFDRPPVEQVQYGMQLLQLWLTTAQDLGGAPSQLQGTRGAKTATGSQILQKNSTVPLQDLVVDLELSTMIPIIRASWMFAQQFREESVMLMVAKESIKVSPEDFAFDADFRWLASSQSVNSQQRAQQAIQLLGAIVPLIPNMMQMGYQFDPVPMIQRLYTDGLGFRNFDQVIKKMAAQGMPPGMPPMPGGPQPQGPMPGGEVQDRTRSMLEAIGGEGVPMVPGEGEAAMDVRAEADPLAALMGGSNGQV